MGQFLEVSEKSAKQKRLPKSLHSVEKKGFLRAAFSLEEVKRLLESTGKTMDDMYDVSQVPCR